MKKNIAMVTLAFLGLVMFLSSCVVVSHPGGHGGYGYNHRPHHQHYHHHH